MEPAVIRNLENKELLVEILHLRSNPNLGNHWEKSFMTPTTQDIF